MHFWIDKRSQTCGFGRARVGASLGGGGVGLGFGHPPRRMASKSLVAPIHRLQSTNNDTVRPHLHNNNNNSSTTTTITNSSNNSNSNNNSNRSHRSRSTNQNNNSSIPYQQQHQQSHDYHQHYQQPRHQNTTVDSHNHNLQRPGQHVHPVASSQECHISTTVPHIYGGPSHVQDLEQGSLGIGSIPARSNMASTASGGHVVAIADATSESQLLPSHLKCGMWASLVLASVFVAGAKFYFDHQGTGLEVLIFCAFSATFFLAACTVSLCRLPRDLAASPSDSVDGHSRGLDGQLHHGASTDGTVTIGQPRQLFAMSVSPIGSDFALTNNSVTAMIAAPPPPYHIAILLPPENGKDIQLDETPPPSYDKILI